ncbi:hypothetical protein SAMN02910275_00960 [Butyrivibrio sp. INlla18]|uniref:hypothetical protein n=1 Tax=Butyrivibrio sp. INlla18 TaxID=1520806 RepID=UPI0008893C42|nr:hypothetical protein [Butyrivibrio sp. INlla18]SDA51421.1 hypothetical protein SAMN02910275_00960 [Butyrivibrio sp. INlla18]
MLAGILTVLKIIGIVFLVILALLIAIILLVLFVPLRYKLDIDIPRTELQSGFDMEKMFLNARFTWLLHFINAGITYPKQKEFEVKILGIRVFPRKVKKTSEKADKIIEAKPSEGVIEMSNMEEKTTEETHEELQNDENIQEQNIEETKKPELEQAEETHEAKVEATSDDVDDEERKSFLDVIWKIIDFVKKLIETPQNVFSKIQYTISRVCGKIDMVKTTLENDIFKRAFALVKGKLIKLIKMILPDRTDIRITLGTGDPALTAEVMAAYGALYPVLAGKVYMDPDFEESVIGLKAHLKGHITCFTVVYCAAVCYFNKDVKKVIRRFKKIMNS